MSFVSYVRRFWGSLSVSFIFFISFSFSASLSRILLGVSVDYPWSLLHPWHRRRPFGHRSAASQMESNVYPHSQLAPQHVPHMSPGQFFIASR